LRPAPFSHDYRTRHHPVGMNPPSLSDSTAARRREWDQQGERLPSVPEIVTHQTGRSIGFRREEEDRLSDPDVVLGPIDYLVVEWPAGKQPTGEGLPLLADLVDRGLIRVLDLAFIHKDEDGSVVGLDLDALGADGAPELTLFEGASSGLLGDDDYMEAGSAIEPGCSAALLVYENTWAAPFATALRRSGAQLVANGRIPVNAIIAALDELEEKE
jgi:hypothetical protein